MDKSIQKTAVKKASYEDFLEGSPNYRKFEGNRQGKEIFENILSREENLIAMVEAAERGKPALSACISEVETYYEEKQIKEFDLTDNFTKQGLGRMVRTALEPFGYQPAGQKDMPRQMGVKYVTSASTYKLTGRPRLKVVKTIQEVIHE
ncbi:hypothetical protein Ami103574_12195 [Aminipila butyrica]|uniref:Uncharacterized protein n=1 Tax=Aminipila butyrica TaxID=433296 RepID=A0A858BYN2_9FIRM|nr:hypothetical protein [Aminipila butyrica]QIB70010.1 hypothetical protein Ami103574_12195 [Aminipila butyrica]